MMEPDLHPFSSDTPRDPKYASHSYLGASGNSDATGGYNHSSALYTRNYSHLVSNQIGMNMSPFSDSLNNSTTVQHATDFTAGESNTLGGMKQQGMDLDTARREDGLVTAGVTTESYVQMQAELKRLQEENTFLQQRASRSPISMWWEEKMEWFQESFSGMSLSGTCGATLDRIPLDNVRGCCSRFSLRQEQDTELDFTNDKPIKRSNAQDIIRVSKAGEDPELTSRLLPETRPNRQTAESGIGLLGGGGVGATDTSPRKKTTQISTELPSYLLEVAQQTENVKIFSKKIVKYTKGMRHQNRMTDSGGIQVTPNPKFFEKSNPKNAFDVMYATNTHTTLMHAKRGDPVGVFLEKGDILFESKIKFTCAPTKSGFMFGIAPAGIDVSSPQLENRHGFYLFTGDQTLYGQDGTREKPLGFERPLDLRPGTVLGLHYHKNRSLSVSVDDKFMGVCAFDHEIPHENWVPTVLFAERSAMFEFTD
eukprot:GDKI01035812.1.p1 GENE.GDKI01035812.1~~GDKI01035812.1.p1  ORF type:complete len:480 (-),score=108.87 GDKI01035812.1:130-1569(-)